MLPERGESAQIACANCSKKYSVQADFGLVTFVCVVQSLRFMNTLTTTRNPASTHLFKLCPKLMYSIPSTATDMRTVGFEVAELTLFQTASLKSARSQISKLSKQGRYPYGLDWLAALHLELSTGSLSLHIPPCSKSHNDMVCS